MSISVPRRSAVLGRLSDISKLPRTARCCWENAKSNEKEKNSRQLVACKKVFLDMICFFRLTNTVHVATDFTIQVDSASNAAMAQH